MTEQIEQLLARIAKAEEYRAGAWSRVIEAARNYAMVKSFGKYLERKFDGNGKPVTRIVSLCGSDREDYAKMFADNALTYAVSALAEESIPLEGR